MAMSLWSRAMCITHISDNRVEHVSSGWDPDRFSILSGSMLNDPLITTLTVSISSSIVDTTVELLKFLIHRESMLGLQVLDPKTISISPKVGS